jgi:Domain of unknown function (DUF4430)
VRRALAASLLVAAVCGCGPARHAGGSGRAALWITRDRGARVLLVTKVPAGLTAMEALRRKAKVETRYGGRFVQSIDGLAGDPGKRRDWFYFVNGYEADRGAADYTLLRGDVEWWDYRSWSKQMRVPIVVGAFPEPFLHGYDGKRRPAVIAVSGYAAKTRPLERLLHARVMDAAERLPKDANILFVGPPLARVRFEARMSSPGASAGSPIRMLFIGHPSDLLRGKYRRRYEVKQP